MGYETLRQRLATRFPSLNDADLERAEGGRDSLLGFLQEHGIDSGEAMMHFGEFMESEGQTVTMLDPPSTSSPQEDSSRSES
ncbi:MAG: hypothetical protein C4320_06305 [Armatimonadota bacterium]